MRTRIGVLALGVCLSVCADESENDAETDAATSSATEGTTSTSATSSTATTSTTDDGSTTSTTTTTTSGTTTSAGSTGTTAADTDTDGDPIGPDVDVSDPQLYSFMFGPEEADEEATDALRTQLAYLDTRTTPIGKLVVYLHGAGTPDPCGSTAMGEELAAMGFHVFEPCYVSNYGVGNCADDIGGCRLEAFEGQDHTDVIAIEPPDSIETRVVRALEYLQTMHPGGDWQFFIDDQGPRWSSIIISGISHGASSSGVIGMNRDVDRVVMLSGPLDSGQTWLLGDPITPIDAFYGFTHQQDGQHQGHQDAFDDLQMPGALTLVDDADPPYGDSQRLYSNAATGDGHSAVQAGGASPQDQGEWVYLPVWRYLYGVE